MENYAFQNDEKIPNGKKDPYPMEAVEIEEDDPWKVTMLKKNFVPWSQLDGSGKVKRALGYLFKIILVLGFLYLFICSLDFLSSAFRLLGGEAAGRVFQKNDIMRNPIAGLMMGVLVTVLVQSSSTSTSIIVSMVGADLLDIKMAIPIVMGANIGTSVTNTIVAIGQIGDKNEFRRAFAGATVHDMFNWLSVIILLPIEVATDYLYHLSDAIVSSMSLSTDENADTEILKVITKPFTEKIIKINKKAITNIAKNKDVKYDYDRQVLKICCDKPTRDKCCTGAVSGLYSDGLVSYSTSQKESFCRNDALQSCAKNIDSAYNSTVATCLNEPWSSKSTSNYVEQIKCSSLTSYATETCCNSQLGTYMSAMKPAERNWTSLCNTISSSCSVPAANQTAFTSACVGSVYNETTRVQFDCYKWTSGVINDTCDDKCDYVFRGLYPDLGDKAIGAILLVISLLLLCVCLVAIVKLLHSILEGPMATLIKKFVNAELPGPFAYFTGYIAILVGAGLTFVVQSSSIFTSTLTPLVGIGVIELERMFPLTLGSNIGTTTTAILSALTADASHLRDTLQIAFCHLFFNITGILIFYPIPFMRFPIPMAKFLGNRTANYRWFALLYILLMFFAFPAIIFGLSVPGWYVLLAVAGPFALIAIIVVIVKIIQAKKPGLLPAKLRNWKWLPKPLRSLEPYDRVMRKVFFCMNFNKGEEDSDPAIKYTENGHNGVNGVNGQNGAKGHSVVNGNANTKI